MDGVRQFSFSRSRHSVSGMEGCSSFVRTRSTIRIYTCSCAMIEFCIDDPELMREGQPSVPKTLLLLHQKVKRLSKPIQALHDLADILV